MHRPRVRQLAFTLLSFLSQTYVATRPNISGLRDGVQCCLSVVILVDYAFHKIWATPDWRRRRGRGFPSYSIGRTSLVHR
jgi:hypothetical protein